MIVNQQELENLYAAAIGNQAVNLVKLQAANAALVKQNAELTAQLAAKTQQLEAFKAQTTIDAMKARQPSVSSTDSGGSQDLVKA